MRELTSHKVNGVNDGLFIAAVDEPGHGGANHSYIIAHKGGKCPSWETSVNFQNGTLPEVGVNGVTHEALLAILIDRLEGFQRGPFACDENAFALIACKAAQKALKERTTKRLARGVEGTHKL